LRALGAFDAEHVELALDIAEDEISPLRHDGILSAMPAGDRRFLMAKQPAQIPRKLVGFDAETWHALNHSRANP
jgi:hypothetical protein